MIIIHICHDAGHLYTQKRFAAARRKGNLHAPLTTTAPVLRVLNGSKDYPGFRALGGVRFDLMAGECLAIVSAFGA